jgi:hypothetical protein
MSTILIIYGVSNDLELKNLGYLSVSTAVAYYLSTKMK